LWRWVQGEEFGVKLALISRIRADDGMRDYLIHVGDRVENAIAAIPILVTVSRLERLCLTGTGAGWNNRPAGKLTIHEHIDLDRWPPTTIQHFAPAHSANFAHNLIV
jgi:hypothetical protein